MKVNTEDIGGEIMHDTSVYRVIDNKFLNDLTLSQTVLHPWEETPGHAYPGFEEIYFVLNGAGRIQLDDEFISVSAGDIVMIPQGSFRKVLNDSSKFDLTFIRIYRCYER